MNRTIYRIDSMAMAVALIGVIMAVLKLEYSWAVIGAGALVSFFMRLYLRAKMTDRNAMRLMAVHMFASVALLASAYIIYSERRYWIIPVVICAVVELYVSFRVRQKKS